MITVVTASLLAVSCSAGPAKDGVPKTAEAKASAKQGGDAEGWKAMFNGKTLAGWKLTDFSTRGEISVESPFRDGPGALVVDQTEMLNGAKFTNSLPKMNYELSLEAMKLQGNDFFCGVTFPIGESHCSLILGGWGGAVVGISSIDGADASENETTKFLKFDQEKWYRVRVRVTPAKIEAWVDDEKMVDVETAGKKISMRPGEIEESVPFGLATYQTRAAFRNIRLRELK